MTDRFTKRVAKANWQTVTDEVNDLGCALLPQLLTPREAAEIAQLCDDAGRFRSTITMARHRFGEGEYRYVDKPFPEAVEALRQALYPRLLPIARDWYPVRSARGWSAVPVRHGVSAIRTDHRHTLGLVFHDGK